MRTNDFMMNFVVHTTRNANKCKEKIYEEAAANLQKLLNNPLKCVMQIMSKHKEEMLFLCSSTEMS